MFPHEGIERLERLQTKRSWYIPKRSLEINHFKAKLDIFPVGSLIECSRCNLSKGVMDESALVWMGELVAGGVDHVIHELSCLLKVYF